MTRRPGREVLVLLVQLLLLATSTPALAGSFRASYEAPAECPDRAAFVRAVEQRLSGWRHGDDAGAAVDREIVVSIAKTSAGYAGTVSLGDSQGKRDVDGTQCESVVRALSLVTAVSLDPAAALASEAPPPEPQPLLAPAPPVAGGRAPPGPDAGRPAPEPDSSAMSLGFGVAAALMFGPAPAPLFGVEGLVSVGDGERRFLVRLSAAQLTTGSVDAGSAPAHFELTHGELGGCHRPIRERVSVMVCGVFDAGRIRATGEPSPALVQTDSSSRLWLAAGARLGVGFQLVGPLELGAGVGVLAPITRQSYVFDNPEEPVHESSPVALDFRLGVSVIAF